MATRAKPQLATVADELEAWRPALIAFYRRESPWMTQTIFDLEHGRPFTADNIRIIEALREAFRVAA